MTRNKHDECGIPKCVWCDKDWTPEMLTQLSNSSGCDTCGYGGGSYGTIEIVCGCEKRKLVYRKEIDTRD